MNQLTFYAKVEEGIVTALHCVTYAFLVANPDRYGNAELWIEAFYNNEGRGYPGIGWTYNAENDVFVAPPTPEVDE